MQSSLPHFVALGADLKVRRPLPLECSFFLPAAWMSDPLMWGSPGGPLPLCSSPPPLQSSIGAGKLPISFNGSIVAAAAALGVPSPSLSLPPPSFPQSPPTPTRVKLGSMDGELGGLFLCSVPPGPDCRVSGLPFPFRAGSCQWPCSLSCLFWEDAVSEAGKLFPQQVNMWDHQDPHSPPSLKLLACVILAFFVGSTSEGR